MTTEGSFLIQKSDDDERLVFGFAYISHDETGEPIVDQEGDFIPTVEELEKAAYDFMLDHRTGDIWHNEVVVAKCVESVVFTKEKLEAWGVPEGTLPQGAWWCGWKVIDDTVWKMVKDGKLAAFSIGGRGMRTPVGVL
jgi:hypothetical protein